ncbi:ACR family transporter [Tateyamaria omphalii]|nr:ACR family transporter [Tateyamaria omphalii]
MFIVMFGGLLTLSNYPSQEEPTIPIKQAVIYAENRSLSIWDTEELLAKPLEAKIEQLPEVRHIFATVRAGKVQLRIELADDHEDVEAAWSRLRTRLANTMLPDGTIGPLVDDDFGRTAVATYAIIPDTDYNWGDTRLAVRMMQDDLNRMEDVSRVTVTGMRPERVVVTLAREKVSALGLAAQDIAAVLNTATLAAPSGFLRVGGRRLNIDADGQLIGLDDLRNQKLPLGDGGAVALRDIARIERETVSPLETAVLFDGAPAVVVGIEMQPGGNVQVFGEALRHRMQELSAKLPVGFKLAEVTFQADVVTNVIAEMQRTLYMTVIVVLIVTIVFLGWRTGMVVGLSIPVTMLAALLFMRPLALELNQVTIASFIIALGILVDNATVVAEDISRRLRNGGLLEDAIVCAPHTLGPPLLVSTLATALAFAPPVFASSLTAEYMRDLAFVMAIVLIVSWLVAVTVIPLLISALIPRGSSTGAKANRAQPCEPWSAMVYRRLLLVILRARILFCTAMLVVLVAALGAAWNIPFSFLPPSDRDQFQIPFEAAPGSTPEATQDKVTQLATFLNDREVNPEITGHVAYIGSGGPRFILGLNPPNPAPHRAFLVVNTVEHADIDKVIERVRHHVQRQMPDVEALPKRFSLGETDTGTAVLRISGEDYQRLVAHGEAVRSAFTRIPGSIEARFDWETMVPGLDAEFDVARLLRSGVSKDQISATLDDSIVGTLATTYQEHGVELPVVFQAPAHERSDFDAIRSFTFSGENGQLIPLSAVADLRLVGVPSVLQRRDFRRTITISARHPSMTAQELVDQVRPDIDRLSLWFGETVEIGGDIEEAAEASAAITEYMPHCIVAILGLFLIQFNSVRRTAIIAASIPFCLVGVSAALLVTGMPFDFMSFLGIFALIGTIVSNAILVIERVDQLRANGADPYDALLDGATQRLRPILLTQLTTIFGLIPLMIAAEPLWRSFNIVVVGGLIAGTLISLGLVPALYAILFKVSPSTKRMHRQVNAAGQER